MEIRPYQTSKASKKVQVRQMFDRIAGRYDLLNRLLSFRADVYWRRELVRRVRPYRPRRILDVATGTGDVVLALTALVPEKIVGIDIAPKMIEHAQRKVAAAASSVHIQLGIADAENLPYDDDAFDAVTVAFGVRNFENLARGLSEMIRVLRRKGVLAILEFSNPGAHPIGWVYRWYARHILPRIGGWISGDPDAYRYLPESIAAFPSGEAFLQVLREAGASDACAYPLTGGIATLYIAEK